MIDKKNKIDLENWNKIKEYVENLKDLQILYKDLNMRFSKGEKTVKVQILGSVSVLPIEKVVQRSQQDFEETKEELLGFNFDIACFLFELCDESDTYISVRGEIVKDPDSEWFSGAEDVKYIPESLKKGTTK